ncbi:MAG: S-layer homology domain-containing protein [Clostridiales bacterium]|nr:S-layer homology domain-containing protein [Clostridiales bacterium]
MKKSLSVLMCLLILFGLSPQSLAADYDEVLHDTAQYVYKTVQNPQVGSVGGEWAVMGLARSGADIPSAYYENYYRRVEDYVKECGGVLHNQKYTEYSRVIIALTAIGKNPAEVSGYNLLESLGDYENTIRQGINGSIWALIALDSGNYDIPQNINAKTQATREMYINHILENQTPDGGWALSGNSADPDITGMALQALAKYRDNENVNAAIEKALLCMSQMQNENGGFSTWESENSESAVQMLTALCELGISQEDERFVKNQNTILDNLLTYYDGNGGFGHTKDGGTNQMATEQGLYALAAVKRFSQGKNSLYCMSDAIKVSVNQTEELKNSDIQKADIVSPEKTFEDIKGHENQSAIEELSRRGVIDGKTENSFEPDQTMTRAEFAAIVTRGLGLPLKEVSGFEDVTYEDWFYSYVNTAYAYGIVNGISDREFNPGGTITREEAAVMLQRAAKLCGMDTDIDAVLARDVLAGFLDYVKASDWAFGSLAFCYREGILPDDAMEIKPKEPVKRAEIAQMLYNTLKLSGLL